MQTRRRYYIHNELTGKQEGLRTKDRAKATRFLHAKNEAGELPANNLQIARACLAATDPQIATRRWQFVMDEMAKFKKGPTQDRWKRATQNKAFDLIRQMPILETRPKYFIPQSGQGADKPL